MRRALARAGVALWLACSASGAAHAFEHGADVSSLPRLEALGARFHADADTSDALTLLARAGVDAVRLRLWHSPADSTSALPAVLALARRAHDARLSLLLDLHLSDDWADPGEQWMPAAWRALDAATLRDSVERYCREVTADFVAQGTAPARVQLGNEIDAGLLWPAGRLAGDDASRDRCAALLAAAARGVEAGAGGARIARMLHIANGGDAEHCRAFLDAMAQRHVPFECIGVSYYPLWHGGLEGLRTNLARIAQRYRRDVCVVECAYPWTLAWFDDERNLFGDDRALLQGFAPTPEGQAAFTRAVRAALDAVPGHRGAGLYWWEPAWIAVQGGRSPWENAALFDSSGALLPAAHALGAR